ncbi:MAG: YfiR family protein [bacterium]|nr:YfiR family protein [bacterium]
MIILLVTCFITTVYSQRKEYAVKAVFLERFTRFIQWPADSDLNDSSKPFVIAVLGKNPFGTLLEKIYSNRTIKNKKVKIRYISGINEIVPCHLLFITGTRKYDLGRIINHLKKKPVLLVSDTDGFAERGVHINLFIVKEQIRFEINETAVKNSKLKMSFRLLQTARIVNPIKK